MTKPNPASRLRLEELECRLVPAVATTSTNWSGYAVQTRAGAVSSVAGSWTVPTVTGSSTAYSSSWVGIDGFSSSTVEQIGTEQDVINGGAQYYAWYEMYPSYSVVIPIAVGAGDKISATVTYVSSAGNQSTFSLHITDTTTQGKVESYTTTQTIRGAQRSSAEWIEEAPSSGFGILPLSNFGTVSFTRSIAVINGTTGAIDNSRWANSSLYVMNMVTSSRGAIEDTTSGLTDSAGTSGFSITYNAAAAVTPTPPPHHRWWFEPNQTATQPAVAMQLAAAAFANARTDVGSSSSVPASSTVSSPAINAQVYSAVASTALGSTLASLPSQSSALLPGGSEVNVKFEANTLQELPPAREPGDLGQPLPAEDILDEAVSGQRQGHSLSALDACFANFLLSPAVDQNATLIVEEPGIDFRFSWSDGQPSVSAAVMVAMALNGSRGIDPEQKSTRRRRLQVAARGAL
jgi:hypothetical protein